MNNISIKTTIYISNNRKEEREKECLERKNQNVPCDRKKTQEQGRHREEMKKHEGKKRKAICENSNLYRGTMKK